MRLFSVITLKKTFNTHCLCSQNFYDYHNSVFNCFYFVLQSREQCTSSEFLPRTASTMERELWLNWQHQTEVNIACILLLSTFYTLCWMLIFSLASILYVTYSVFQFHVQAKQVNHINRIISIPIIYMGESTLMFSTNMFYFSSGTGKDK